MKHPLTKFRETRSETLEAFAACIGASKGMVWKWENGSIPSPDYMRKIIDLSNGTVTANDWYAVKHSDALATAVDRVDDAHVALTDASEALAKIVDAGAA